MGTCSGLELGIGCVCQISTTRTPSLHSLNLYTVLPLLCKDDESANPVNGTSQLDPNQISLESLLNAIHSGLCRTPAPPQPSLPPNPYFRSILILPVTPAQYRRCYQCNCVFACQSLAAGSVISSFSEYRILGRAL